MTPLPALIPKSVGKPLDRVDGRLKVTGGAKYSAEFTPAGTVYAAVVRSVFAKGTLRSVDASAAKKASGFIGLITRENAPKLAEPKNDFMGGGGRSEMRIPLSDDVISYAGQPLAIVVCETFEQARHAASLVRVDCAQETPVLNMQEAKPDKPKENMGEELQLHHGDGAPAFRPGAGSVVVDEAYTTPAETHNPMEPSATVAFWTAPDQLSVYDATQWIKGTQATLADAFGLPRANVRVRCPYVGGGFGCKGFIWPHTIMAAMAAKIVGKPVKLALTRSDMFVSVGHRSPTVQNIALAADPDGKLRAMRHYSHNLSSPIGDFTETCGIGTTKVLYASPAIDVEHTVYKVNVATPTFMRAPGETPGTFALESAMDELAAKLRLDPIELRLRNYAEIHPVTDKPWSGKHLRDCYRIGAERFGWARRNPAPGSMRDGKLLVGWGMATAVYPAYKFAGSARVRLSADGTAHVVSATHDLGTGAYTAFTQISADALTLPAEKVTFDLGDSAFPIAPVAGGSNSTATVGQAIMEAARAAHAALGALAMADAASPLHGAAPESIVASEGRLKLRDDPAKGETFAAILQRAGKPFIEVEGSAQPGEEQQKFALTSFGAQFCEVKIDPDLPRVRVTRFVSVIDNGRVINPKTSDSQVKGGVIMGLGMALMEETAYDPLTGLPAGRSLADYHICVNADVPEIEVHFINEPDMNLNAMGARGIGEIGITGVAAAVANAIYHATGKRIRELPITPDKLLA